MQRTGLFYVTQTVMPEVLMDNEKMEMRWIREHLEHEMSFAISEAISDGRTYIVKLFDMERTSGLYEIFTVRAFCVLARADDAEIGEYAWLLKFDPEDAMKTYLHYDEDGNESHYFERVDFNCRGKLFTSWRRVE